MSQQAIDFFFDVLDYTPVPLGIGLGIFLGWLATR